MHRSVPAALVNLVVLAACASSSVPSELSVPASASSGVRDTCAEQDVGLDEVLAVAPEARAECFGTTSISFRAYVSSMIGIGGYPEQLSPGDGWLDPSLTPRRLLVPIPGDEERVLAALVPPTVSLDDVPADRWAIVTGHADPAADTCGRVAADGSVIIDATTIEACRALFVIERVVPAG